jgi:hypothetical protein
VAVHIAGRDAGPVCGLGGLGVAEVVGVQVAKREQDFGLAELGPLSSTWRGVSATTDHAHKSLKSPPGRGAVGRGTSRVAVTGATSAPCRPPRAQAADLYG